METVHDILSQAVQEASEIEDDDSRIDWGAYWLHALPLHEMGWGWAKIYLYLDARLRQAGRKMPGDEPKFSKAMSARWQIHKKQLQAAAKASHPDRAPKFETGESPAVAAIRSLKSKTQSRSRK